MGGKLLEISNVAKDLRSTAESKLDVLFAAWLGKKSAAVGFLGCAATLDRAAEILVPVPNCLWHVSPDILLISVKRRGLWSCRCVGLGEILPSWWNLVKVHNKLGDLALLSGDWCWHCTSVEMCGGSSNSRMPEADLLVA